MTRAHGSQSMPDGNAIDLIPIADQVARGLIPRECLCDLTDQRHTSSNRRLDRATEQFEEEAKVLWVALVRCRGHQKIVVRHRRQRLTELVGERLFVSAVRRHFVRLVDDHEVPAAAEQALLGVLDARDPGDRRYDQAGAIERPRPDCVAGDAVSCELVSAPNSLLTGKLTGNFANSGPQQRFPHLINELIQSLAAKFPTQRNREFSQP